jgi:hypothetical protein
MLCPSCNKFAANDTSTDPELNLDVENGIVTGDARIVITSECCGDELKEATFEVEIDLEDKFEDAIRELEELADDAEVNLDDWSFEITSESADWIDRSETEKVRILKDGTEKRTPIPYRYQKHFYGVSVEVEVTATKGDKAVTASGTFEDEVPAGSMDEC